MAEEVRRVGAPDNDEAGADRSNAKGSANNLNGSGNSNHIGTSILRTSVNPINADRPVFTLSVAADLLGMHPRTLRIYEEEELVVPARTPTGRRRYSQNDIKRFQFVQHLTQQHKVNLAGVRIILDMMEQLDRCGVDYRPQLTQMAENRPARKAAVPDEEE